MTSSSLGRLAAVIGMLTGAAVLNAGLAARAQEAETSRPSTGAILLAPRQAGQSEEDRKALQRQIAELRKQIETLRKQEEGLLKRLEQTEAQRKQQEALLKRLEQADLWARTRAILRFESPIYSLAVSPNGTLLAVGSGGKNAYLWDIAAGKERRQLPMASRGVFVVAFSPDGKILAAGCIHGPITLWDAATGKEIHRFRKQGESTCALAFAPDGKTLASGDYNGGMIRLWDVAGGKELRSWHGHNHHITSLAFAPDGKMFATGSGHGDRAIRVWNAADGTKVCEFAGGDVMGLAFAPDGKLASAAYYEKDVLLWDMATGRGPRRFPSLALGLTCVAFSADAQSLYSAGSDKVLKLWEVRTGRERCRFEGHLALVRAVASTPDGRMIASGDSDGEVLLWDVPGSLQGMSAAGKSLEALWADLESEDAARAYAAHWQLLGSPKPSAAFLAKHVQPAKAQPAKSVKELIAELDNDSYDVREKATKALETIGDAAESALREAAEKHASLEVRRRAGRILGKLWDVSPTGAELRTLRAIEILERLGTPEARAVLEQLAGGAEGARLTREAKAELERLARRAK